MRNRRILALLTAIVLVLGLMAGCGSPAAVSGETTVSASDELQPLPQETPAPEAPVTDSVLEEPISVEEPAAVTGAILDAETCRAMGYEVEHGMYDLETYVSLPLTDSGESLSYWLMIQPFMMNYNVELSECTYFREMEARTGVHLELTAASFFSAADQFALMITSGSYTDIMEGALSYYNGGGTKAIEDGVLMDLTPLLEDMPNYAAWMDFDPKLRAAVTTLDGAIACAAGYTGQEKNVGPQIRKDWLDELGLELPVTYDDYHDVLTAFHNKYGATLWLDGDGTHRNNCFSSGYDVQVASFYSDFRAIDGVVEYSPQTTDYQDYMTLMNDWWNQGLIYSDFLSQANISTPDNGLVLNNAVGIWTSDTDTMMGYNQLSDEILVCGVGQPRKTSDQILHLYIPDFASMDGASITTTCADPTLAARWLDYNYTYEGGLLCTYGVEGEGLTFDQDGNPRYSDLVLENEEMITVACSIVYSKYGGAGICNENRFMASYNQLQKDAVALWTENVDNAHELPYGLPMSIEETETYSTLLSEISTYVDQMTLSFITGEKSPVQDWDSYQNTLASMGVDQLVALCQTAYDRYMQQFE